MSELENADLPEDDEDVRYCLVCGCSTWHKGGVCEWEDMHRQAAPLEGNNVR